jgi:hypothetical protein
MSKPHAKREYLEACVEKGYVWIVCSKDVYKDFVIASKGLKLNPIVEDPTGFIPEDSAHGFETRERLEVYLDNITTEVRAMMLRRGSV